MKFKKFPMLDMCDFKMVIIDVTRAKNGTHSVVFNFFKRFADGKRRAKGLLLSTHIEGESLNEVFHKWTAIYDTGFFNGSEVSAHGHLYDHRGDMISEINWFEVADQGDEDITEEIILSTGRTLH